MKLKNNHPNAGANKAGEVVYILGAHSVGNLEGKILTITDASVSDPEQRKALKDLFRQTIWDWAISSNMVDLYDWEKSTLEWRASASPDL